MEGKMDRIKFSKRYSLKAILMITVLIILTSCGSLRPMSPKAKLDNELAQKVTIFLSDPFSFEYGLATHTLPQGKYVPVLEDDEGVYI